MNKLTFAITFLLHSVLYSQGLISNKEYFTYPHTGKLAHTWSVYADGTKHGTELYYYSNGRIQWNGLWDKGVIKKVTANYEDGSIQFSANYHDRWVLEGEQKLYDMKNGVKYLRYNARTSKRLFKNEKESYYYTNVDFMEFYSNPNTRLFQYSNINNTREFIEGSGADEKKLSIVDGKLMSAKTTDEEISNGRFIKIRSNKNTVTKVFGDTIHLYQVENEKDSSVYSMARTGDMNIELITETSINPDNLYFSFKLTNAIPGVQLPYSKDRIAIVNYNEMESNFSNVMENAFLYYYSKRGWYRKHSRKTGKALYESFTNNQGVIELENSFYDNGMMKEERVGSTIKKYSYSGILIEKRSSDTIQRYFENGLLALDSTSKYSRAYFLNGKISRDISMVSGSVNTYKIYDTLGTIIFQGEIKTSISNKNKDAIASEEKLNYKYTLAEENMESIKKNIAYKNLNHETIIFYNDENDKILGSYLFKFYQELWNQLTLEGVNLNNSLKPFQNLNWNESYGRIEKDVIPKDIYLNLCFLYYSKATSIYSQMDGLINKFELILKSADKKKVIKSLKKATSDSEIKSILGI